MATRAEKEELIETLKFTPHNITIQLTGYGGEIAIGKIDAKTAEYWSKRDDLEEYANKWDDEEYSDVPKEFDFIDGNMWYELDNLGHNTGVEMGESSWIAVTDDSTGETLLETDLDPETLENTGCQVSEWETVDVEDHLATHGVFVGQNLEKGLFFEATFEITRPFDPKLLSFHYSTYDGWRILDGVQYDGEDLDGMDAYSTTGKSSSFTVYVCEGEDDIPTADSETMRQAVDEFVNGYSKIVEYMSDDEWEHFGKESIDESELGPWHLTEDCNPVHLGYYDCQILSTQWPEQRLRWDGETWIGYNGEPMRLHVSAWRGLNHPPVDR